MKAAAASGSVGRGKGQVYSVGNYLMTGKVLGKGHFARVEEATHRIIGKKVAIKIIDLTCIKEEYARRNLHREPRVMAKLRHPCIAALYETMMHGPRLYVVMEAAGGGDLCAHVLAARGAQRGLPEARARALAAQLVSAVRHMHARGVVHRDLKMENIMLDVTKQFIKIVDFGLSNVWMAGGALRTPCGSLEYAAPELFVDGRRYGPEVDLWSIGVIVYGMVTGGLPFGGGEAGEGRSRPQLRANIARGFTRKQRAQLACVSNECKMFVQHLLEPNVELRMKIEEAARHRWVKRPGLRMKAYPLQPLDAKANREIYRQISEISGQMVTDVVAQVKAEPFGAIAGMYNIKTHLQQLQATPGVELLWSSMALEARPSSPPEYLATPADARPESAPQGGGARQEPAAQQHHHPAPKTIFNGRPRDSTARPGVQAQASRAAPSQPLRSLQSPRFRLGWLQQPHKAHDSGDCALELEPRLPSIEEHANGEAGRGARRRLPPTQLRKAAPEEDRRLNSCPSRMGDGKRADFYRRAGDCLHSWRTGGPLVPAPKILLQSAATTIKRASLGNIVSPHSSTNSHCKSERAMPAGWFSTRSTPGREPALQRLRRMAPIK